MWSDPKRAERLPCFVHADPFDWGPGHRALSKSTMVPAPTAPPPQPPPTPEPLRTLADVEREAFTKGYEQGERSGAQAAAARGDAMLRRLGETLEQLSALRGELIQKTERQLVQLALAIAGRILRREISLDRDLLVAMARVAIDRLGETASATIRLNPDDYALVRHAGAGAEHSAVRVIADPLVSPGGCLVQSDFGLMDVGIDAQLTEFATALLGDSASALGLATDDTTAGGPRE